MATVTGLTADRMLAIELASVVSARREGANIILTTKGGVDFDLGDFQGEAGPQGDVGLQSINMTYAKSQNGTTAPTSGYTTTIPSTQAGWYLWTKIEFVGADNSVTVGYLNSRMGTNGEISSVNGKTGSSIVLNATDVGAVSPTDPNYKIPPGTIWDYAGNTIPESWVECDGKYYQRTAYPALFAAIGTTWGSSTGTNFRVPDLRGAVTAGVDPSETAFNAVAKTVGVKTRLLTAALIPTLSAESGGSHTHDVTIGSAGAHTHTMTVSTDGSHTHRISVNSGGAHTHGVGGLKRFMTTNRSSDFSPRNAPTQIDGTAVVPAYGGNDTQTVGSESTTSSSGAHSHTATSSNTGNHTHSVTANNTGAHSHVATAATSGNHTHVVNSGSQTALDMRQTTVAVRKIIKL